MNGKRVVCIVGPTACGKTALGVRLAQLYGGEVVSADSMQLYRGMEIGTASPTQEERCGVAHHMIGVADPKEPYSVARYVTEASACVDHLLECGRLPIIVGGTGLYMDALVAGRDFAGGLEGGAVREALKRRLECEGIAALYGRLCEIDPTAAQKIHPHNVKRVLRALEVYEQTGETITSHNIRTQARAPRYGAVYIGLTYEARSDLYEVIDARVDAMLARGLLDEVRALRDAGVGADTTAMQAIGYKELLPVLDGECDLASAAESIKRRSRQYAKRQLTWLKRNERIHWIYWKKTRDIESACQISTNILKAEGLG